MTVALVGLGGAVGAMLRWYLARLNRPTLPLGTLVANLSGSLALGVLVGSDALGTLAVALSAGLLGGLTTFSTLIVEARGLSGRDRGRYLSATIIGGIALAALGLLLGHLLSVR